LPETAGKAAAPAASFRKCRRARSIADLPYRSKDVENAGHKTRPRQYPMLLYWNNAIFASIDSNLAIGLADANERFPRTALQFARPASQQFVRFWNNSGHRTVIFGQSWFR